jgi:hypothetical protein
MAGWYLAEAKYRRMSASLSEENSAQILLRRVSFDESLPKKRSKRILVADHFTRIARGFFFAP